MPDLPSVTNLINSPPGQLAAGAALAGIVWKFFERVEAVLADQTKHEIGDWLRGVDLARAPNMLKEIMIKTFNLGFGDHQISWRCGIATFVITLAAAMTASQTVLLPPYQMLANHPSLAKTVLASTLILVGPVFWSVRCLREGVQKIEDSTNLLQMLRYYLWACLKSIYSLFLLVLISVWFGGLFQFPQLYSESGDEFLMRITGETLFDWIVLGIPGVLLLFFASAYALRGAVRLRIALNWFNRKFDIEKKPLSAIGLVSGTLVALLYWAWAVLRHFVPA